jgi:hypothetical protein
VPNVFKPLQRNENLPPTPEGARGTAPSTPSASTSASSQGSGSIGQKRNYSPYKSLPPSPFNGFTGGEDPNDKISQFTSQASEAGSISFSPTPFDLNSDSDTSGLSSSLQKLSTTTHREVHREDRDGCTNDDDDFAQDIKTRRIGGKREEDAHDARSKRKKKKDDSSSAASSSRILRNLQDHNNIGNKEGESNTESEPQEQQLSQVSGCLSSTLSVDF